MDFYVFCSCKTYAYILFGSLDKYRIFAKRKKFMLSQRVYNFFVWKSMHEHYTNSLANMEQTCL